MSDIRWRSGAVVLLGFVASVWSSSCSDASSGSPQDPSQPSELGTVAQAVDGCNAETRTQCGSVGCGCLNNSCSGGFCPEVVLIDGCTPGEASSCAGVGCGCLNGRCSGGVGCAPLLDGCTNDARHASALFGCGCQNERPNGDSCPAEFDFCDDATRGSCAAGGCGCFNNRCTGNACQTATEDGCSSQKRSDCLFFGCGCKNEECFGGFCSEPANDSLELPIPPVLRPTASDATQDFYDVTIKTGTTRMKKTGDRTPIVGFNNLFPGPTIVATKGKMVKVRQFNSWKDTALTADERKVSIHNHGHKAKPEHDGHPIDTIPAPPAQGPSSSKIYEYPNDQRAGTYWLHDHTNLRTAHNVYSGLAGFYIIRDPAENAFNLPSGRYDIPLLVQDKSLDATNKLVGLGGSVAVVNGAERPHLNVDTVRYRFRILNGATDRVLNLALSPARTFRVIASDGGLLGSAVTVGPGQQVAQLRVAPAERYDIVVDFNGKALNFTESLTDVGGLGDILQFRVKRQVTPDPSTDTTSFTAIPRFTAAEAGTRIVNFSFSVGAGGWSLKDNVSPNPPMVFNPAAGADVGSLLNQVTMWTLTNTNPPVVMSHPFHKHLAQFQILDVDPDSSGPLPAVAPSPEQMGWKDTVHVAPNATVRILFKNESFTTVKPPGTASASLPYVFHCHNLLHEDQGMMLEEAVCAQLPCP